MGTNSVIHFKRIIKMRKTIYYTLRSARLLKLVGLILALYTITGCSNNKEDLFITDTNLGILQTNKSNLETLLASSTYGTAPGTYPEESKAILTAAISKLETTISGLKSGGSITNNELELQVAAVNQAIDGFKNSRLYNLSPQAQQFITNLKAKAQEYAAILNDAAKWGNHKGQYPVESKEILQNAITSLYNFAENILSGAVSNVTQALYDDAIQSAAEAMQKVEDTRWQEDHVTWNLFVDGNNGGYIDFGYKEDFVRFGPDNHQNFTIELWVNIKEFCNKPGEDNSTFLASFVESPRSGWRVQYRKVNNGNEHWLRGSMAHWQNEGPKDPEWWEPRAIVSNPKDKWTHFAFAVADDGVPGFSPPQEHTKSCVFVNGSQTGEVIRVGEPWRTYIEDGSVDQQMPMTAFCRLGSDKITRHEYFSGYIKYIRIWKGVRSQDDIRASALGNHQVDPDDPNLVAAWDFETLGNKPEGTAIRDLTGRHTATLKGTFKWLESSGIPQ
ncbi:DUF4972 domain-containing protein [Niabella aquatica]